MCENAPDGVGVGVSRSHVAGIYAVCRDRISRYQRWQDSENKLGGKGKSVYVDVLRFHIRNFKTSK
jgi:hypothetical protein